MKISLIQTTIFILCGLTAVTLAMPTHLLDGDVEVRSEISSDSNAPAYLSDVGIRSETFELEERRGGGGAGEFVDLIINIIINIKEQIAQDKANRGDFTTNLIKSLRTKDPRFNYVVCHTKHDTAFDGEKGKDWGHSHQEFDIKIGGTIGYEIYFAKSGKFTRKGDGGFLNWAFAGNVKSRSKDGKEIIFAPP